MFPSFLVPPYTYHIVSNFTLDVYGGTRNEENISYIPDLSIR